MFQNELANYIPINLDNTLTAVSALEVYEYKKRESNNLQPLLFPLLGHLFNLFISILLFLPFFWMSLSHELSQIRMVIIHPSVITIKLLSLFVAKLFEYILRDRLMSFFDDTRQ